MAVGGIGWLLLLALPLLLVLAHLLSRRHRPHVVSSLKLWDRVASEGLSARRVALRRIDASLVLGVAILTCLGLAAAGLWLVDRRPDPAHAVVVDRSPSMAVGDAASSARRIDVARTAALDLLRGSRASAGRLLLLGGDPIAAVTAASGTTTAFEEVLRDVDVAPVPVPLDDLVSVASEWVRRRGGGRVTVVSDFATVSFANAEPMGDVAVDTVVVGAAMPNVAITSLHAARTLADEVVAAATVVNAAPDVRPLTLSAVVDGEVLRGTTLDLAPGGSAIWSFRADAGAVDHLEVRARPGGAFALDDTLRRELPPGLALRGEGTLPVELAAALELLPAPTPGDGSAVVAAFRQRLPARLPSRWMFLPPSRQAEREPPGPPVVVDVVDERGGFLDRHQPILLGPAALSDSDPPPGAIPVAFAGGKPAVALVDTPSTRGVWSGVAWEATSLAATGDLPLLLSDMLGWLAGDPATHAPNLTPAPPANARPADALTTSPPRSLRGPLLLVGSVLVLAAILSRLVALRRAPGGALGIRDALPLVLALVLLVVAHFGPRWTTHAPGALAFVIDLPAATAKRANETIASAREQLPGATPSSTLVTGRAAGEVVTPEGTDLARAIDRGAGWVVASGGGSVLVVTDGRDPGRRVRRAAESAARNGVDVNVMPVVSADAEVAVEVLHLPPAGRAGEVVEAIVVARSNVDQDATVTVERDGMPVAASVGALRAGAGHAFRFLVTVPPTSGELVAHVAGTADADPSNNLARAYLRVDGRPRLAVFGHGGEALPPPPLLDRYDALLLRLGGGFVPTAAEEEALSAFVRSGRGLVVTCADPELAGTLRGGTLESLLPVRLEPPDRPAAKAAVVMLFDRSGSMERRTGGRPAVELAADAVRALSTLLKDDDRYGVIAFDVRPHVLRPLARPADGDEVTWTAADVVPEGGTDWGPALDLALEWLGRDRADYRHVILIGDGRLGPGATGEPTVPWPEGVTLSTVTVGDDADRARLERLAVRRNGRHDHVARLEDLPAAIRREAARSRLPQVRPGPQATTTDASFAALLPRVQVARGRQTLVVDARPHAEIAVRSEAGDPLLAFGRAGWGSVGFLATDPDALEVAPGEGVPPERLVETALARVAGGVDDALARIGFDGALATVELLVDDGAQLLPDAAVRWPSGARLPLEWTASAPGRLHASFVPRQPGEYVVEVGGARTRLSQPTAPALARSNPDRDWATRLAGAGNGQVVPFSADREIRLPRPRARRLEHDLTSLLIAVAAIVVFLDALRRQFVRRRLS